MKPIIQDIGEINNQGNTSGATEHVSTLKKWIHKSKYSNPKTARSP